MMLKNLICCFVISSLAVLLADISSGAAYKYWLSVVLIINSRIFILFNR
jgi:hypothetical protein